MDTLLPGIAAERMPTSRLTVNVLEMAGRNTGHTRERTAVLFVHGNVSSLLFWQPMMLALPETFRPLAIDLRGFGDTDDEPVIATRGLRDFSDDLAAAIEALGLETVHLVGWSMGGGVVLQYLVDRPGTHRVASLTLVGLHRVGRCRASSAGDHHFRGRRLSGPVLTGRPALDRVGDGRAGRPGRGARRPRCANHAG